MSLPLDPTADLAAATDAMLAALRPVHGPCAALPGETEDGKAWIVFRPVTHHATDNAQALLTVEPHAGGYAVIDDGDGDAVVSTGLTPAEAIWAAVEALRLSRAA